jgi:hypothetical protein
MSSRFYLVKTLFLFNGFLSIKMPWVRTFFTNLEIASPVGQVVLGNLRWNFLLHDLYEFFSHNNQMKTLCSKLCITWAIKTQTRAQQNDASVTVYSVTLTHWLGWLPNEWSSVCREIPQCRPIRRSQKLPALPISLRSEQYMYMCGKWNLRTEKNGLQV